MKKGKELIEPDPAPDHPDDFLHKNVQKETKEERKVSGYNPKKFVSKFNLNKNVSDQE